MNITPEGIAWMANVRDFAEKELVRQNAIVDIPPGMQGVINAQRRMTEALYDLAEFSLWAVRLLELVPQIAADAIPTPKTHESVK